MIEIVPVLFGALNSPGIHIRKTAARALVNYDVPPEQAIPALEKVRETYPSSGVVDTVIDNVIDYFEDML